MDIILILLLSLASGIFYRMGGSGRYPRQVRLGGCTICAIAARWIVGIHAPWWTDLIMGAFLVAAISTYWDFMFRGYDNYWFHGFMIGLSSWPYVVWGDYTWYWFLGRAVLLAVFMGAWCTIFSWDVLEENGRGASIPLSALMR